MKRLLPTVTATIASASATDAALVQITLTGNSFTAGAGNNLNADFTGDGQDDVGFTRLDSRFSYSSYNSFVYLAAVRINGSDAAAFSSSTSSTGGKVFAQVPNAESNRVPGGQATGGIPFTFTDANYGGTVNAFLEISAGGFHSTRGVTLNRVVFDDENLSSAPTLNQVVGQGTFAEATQVPEPSSLALLALGATGLITRRKRAAA